MKTAIDRLAAALGSMDRTAVAVSGGVDSLTLATFAHRAGGECRMFHAVSPAVPAEATQRVEVLARQEGWRMTLIDAGEFNDARYRANPVDRCLHCKSALYDAIAAACDGAQIVSGTNRDDLGEYRPGLDAARKRGVRHPFVEAGIDKAGVRELARQLALADIATLPASPCLSSRIETGIAIDAGRLAVVHAVEKFVKALVQPHTVRCRVRASGIVVELDEASLAGLDEEGADALRAGVRRFTGNDGEVALAPYRNGSAFLRAGTP